MRYVDGLSCPSPKKLQAYRRIAEGGQDLA